MEAFTQARLYDLKLAGIDAPAVSRLSCCHYGEIVRLHTVLVEAVFENHFAESFM
jgi:hypothetical protein